MAFFPQADKNFRCYECGSDSELIYNQMRYEIVCRRCRVSYSVEEISTRPQEPYWITPDRRAMRLALLTDEQLNEAIASLITNPENRPGYLALLLEELENRNSREDHTKWLANPDYQAD